MKSVLRQIAGRSISIIRPYRPAEVQKSEWEAQYSRGDWERLRKIDEIAHYNVIVGYCKYFKRKGSILDVGCGYGLFIETFLPNAYAKYVGIDISEEAIQQAAKSQDDRTRFVCADATTYNTDEQFDIIILNEVLYYFSDPLSVVKRYKRFLNKDGIIILSMHWTHRSRKLWKILNASYSIMDSTVVTNKAGTSWKIAVV